MGITQMKNGRALSMPAGIALGSLAALLLTLAMAVGLAWLMGKEVVKEDGIGIGAACILVVCSFAGAMTAFGGVRHRRMLVCLVSGLAYFLLLLSCNALFFGGEYQAVIATALAVLGGSGAAALLGLKGENKRPGGQRKKYRSR